MTPNDYIVIAEVIAFFGEDINKKELITVLAAELAKESSTFNPAKFVLACYKPK